jgi:hypothetical protein
MIPLIPIVVMFFATLYGVYRASESKKWPTVQGTVLSSKVDTTVSYRTKDSRTGAQATKTTPVNRREKVYTYRYFAKITYKYQLNGIENQSSNYTGSSTQEGTLTWVQDLVGKSPVNTELTVYYNPNNPDDSLLVLHDVDISGPIFTFVFMVLLIFLLLKQLKNRRKIIENSSDLNY